MLEGEGYDVIRIGCLSESPFHLIASNEEVVRYIHVHTRAEIPILAIEKFRLPKTVTREIWKWARRQTTPEIVVL